MTKWYGNLNNRIMENNKQPKLTEGMDITQCYWSDRHCYYIDKVINEKEIIVKPYYVCANKEESNDMGHQNWLYFKSQNDKNEYLNNYFADKLPTDLEESSGIHWYFRYGGWYTKQESYYGEKLEKPIWHKIDGISWNCRNYYYDWEF